ncbi:hypothetical protein B0H16DRAFT_1572637 [Mycena metata]|uniref:F-box domain-containing protein n=1 Tax=Mycena metata TaxID=1033252 RepID=A0AAD7I811_9AGAR|nr:hypothetical protein B0H16DRAFT_1572637 [Mycena metata]
MLLELSPELLQEIGIQLATPDQKNVRLTCRSINLATQPVFFSCLTLQVGGRGRNFEILDAILAGKTGWPRWARTLKLVPLVAPADVASDDSRSDPLVREVFTALLASLPNLRTVRWQTYGSDPDWARGVVSGFLGDLAGLKDFRLDVAARAGVPLCVIGGLTSLTLTSPAWPPRDLTSWIWKTILKSCTTLVALNVSGYDFKISDIWTRLASMASLGGPDSVRLTELTANNITPDLLTYLGSYSGLRRLNLQYPDGGSEAESDRLADLFFETVLPRHTNSMVELSCPAGFEGRWSFGIHNIDVFSQLRHLTQLEISVNADEVSRVKPEDNVIRLLLQTITRIPALRTLAIVPANTEKNRGARCGSGWSHYNRIVKKSIRVTVESFRTQIPSTVLLRVGYRWYRLKPVSIDAHSSLGGGESASQAPVLAYHEFRHPDIPWQRLRIFDDEDE